MYKRVEKCRICGNTYMVDILDLGAQALTGVFPKSKDEVVTGGPLQLVKCCGDDSVCGLVQLKHSYEKEELYGDNYGYRSGLNPSMVAHLQSRVDKILEVLSLERGDLVIDIGSNDGTLLRAYPQSGATFLGIDPTGKIFKHYYSAPIQILPEFFSAAAVRAACGGKKAKVITAIAMFYDLENPLDFVQQVHDVLADDGICVFEQSYLPKMLAMNAYDTVCHEHLEYYGLRQIKWLTDQAGFKIIDCELNDVNGGSLAVTVAKSTAPYRENLATVQQLLRTEEQQGLQTLEPYQAFEQRVFEHRDNLCGFLQRARSNDERILGYGASTKGNVILQFCRLTEKEIPMIAEVNTSKFGHYTPGTHIPIVSEARVRAEKPDYLMVLPWHFKESIIERERAYLESGGKLFFPLPSLNTVAR